MRLKVHIRLVVITIVFSLWIFVNSCKRDESVNPVIDNPGLLISRISPDTVGESDVIHIEGQGFSQNVLLDEVSIGHEGFALVEHASETSLDVRLPGFLQDCGPVTVKIKVDTSETESAESIVIGCPTILSLNKKSGTEGDVVIISGKYFTPSSGRVQVNIGYTSLNVNASTYTLINATIPSYKVSGKYPITININNKSGRSQDIFTLKGPFIDNFSPNDVSGCDLITINGEGFSPVADENIVSISGSKRAIIHSASANKLVVWPPPDNKEILDRPANIFVTVNGKSGISSDTIFVRSSWSKISSFDAASRVGGVGFGLNNKGYVGLGQEVNGNYSVLLSDFWEYNPGSDSWVSKSTFPGTPRMQAISFTANSKAYVGLGGDTEGNYLVAVRI